MAAAGVEPFLPDLAGADRRALAKGELTDALRSAFVEMAEDGLQVIAEGRKAPLLNLADCTPALMPIAHSEKVLEAVRKPDFSFKALENLKRPFDGLRMAWRARSGRW